MTRREIGRNIVRTVVVAYFVLSLIGALGNQDWALVTLLMIPLVWITAIWWTNRRTAHEAGQEVHEGPAPALRELVAAEQREGR